MQQYTSNVKPESKKSKELTKYEVWDSLEKKITSSFLAKSGLTSNEKKILLDPLRKLFLNALGLDINIVEGEAGLDNVDKFVISSETYKSDDSLLSKYNFLNAAFIKRANDIRASFEKIDKKILDSLNIKELMTLFGSKLLEEISKKTFKLPKEKQFYFFKYRETFLNNAMPTRGLLFDQDCSNLAIKPSLDYFVDANDSFKFYEKWHQFSQMYSNSFKKDLNFQTNLFLPLKEIYINTVSLLFTQVENSLGDDIDNLLITKATSDDPQKKDDFIRQFFANKAQNISAQINQFDLSRHDTLEDHKKLNDLFVLYKEFFISNLKEKLPNIPQANLELYSQYRILFLSQIVPNNQAIKPKFDELRAAILQIFRESNPQTTFAQDSDVKVSDRNYSDLASDALSPSSSIPILVGSNDDIAKAKVNGDQGIGLLSGQDPSLQSPQFNGKQDEVFPRVLNQLVPRSISSRDSLVGFAGDGIVALGHEISSQPLKQEWDDSLLQPQTSSLANEMPEMRAELSETQNHTELTEQILSMLGESLNTSEWLNIGETESVNIPMRSIEFANWLPTENFDKEVQLQKLLEMLLKEKQNLIQQNAELSKSRILNYKFNCVLDLLKSAHQDQIDPSAKKPTLLKVEELKKAIQDSKAELIRLKDTNSELLIKINAEKQQEVSKLKKTIEALEEQNKSFEALEEQNKLLQELVEKQKIIIAESSERVLPREVADGGGLESILQHSRELQAHEQMIARQLHDNRELDQQLQDERQVSQSKDAKIQELEQQLKLLQERSTELQSKEYLIRQKNSELLQQIEKITKEHGQSILTLRAEHVIRVIDFNKQLQDERQANQTLQRENDRLQKQLQDERQAIGEKIQELRTESNKLLGLLDESSRLVTFLEEDISLQSKKKDQESLENSNHSSQIEKNITILSEGIELLNKALVSATEQINKSSSQPDQRLRDNIAKSDSDHSQDLATEVIQISSKDSANEAISISSSPVRVLLDAQPDQILVDGNASGNSGFSQRGGGVSIFSPSSPMEAPSTLTHQKNSQRDSNDCDDSMSRVAQFRGAELSPRGIISNSSHVVDAESLDGETAPRGFLGSSLARRVSDIYRSVVGSKS